MMSSCKTVQLKMCKNRQSKPVAAAGKEIAHRLDAPNKRQMVKTLFNVAFLLGVYLSGARFAQTGEIDFNLDLGIFSKRGNCLQANAALN